MCGRVPKTSPYRDSIPGPSSPQQSATPAALSLAAKESSAEKNCLHVLGNQQVRDQDLVSCSRLQVGNLVRFRLTSDRHIRLTIFKHAHLPNLMIYLFLDQQTPRTGWTRRHGLTLAVKLGVLTDVFSRLTQHPQYKHVATCTQPTTASSTYFPTFCMQHWLRGR